MFFEHQISIFPRFLFAKGVTRKASIRDFFQIQKHLTNTKLIYSFISRSLTAEPGFMGVAAGRGVITCPPWGRCNQKTSDFTADSFKATLMLLHHSSYRLSLPEGVHHRTFLLSHHAVVPLPGFWVYGLPYSPQNLQRGPLIPGDNKHKNWSEINTHLNVLKMI